MHIKRGAGASDVRGKVLIWYWGRRGGGPLLTQLLAQHLLESGFGGRLVLSLSAQSERIEAARGLDAELLEIDTFGAEPSLFALAAQASRLRGELRRLMRRVRPDAVVIPMLFGAAPLAIDLARRTGTLIYVAHDARPHPGEVGGRSQHWAQAMLINLADQIVAPSHFSAGELGRLNPRAAGRMGVEPLAGLYCAACAAPRPAPVGRPLRFVAPGRLVRYKGYRRLAAALDLVPNDLAFEVTIAGDGPDRAEVERLFSRRPSVRLALRWHAPEEQAALFREHDVLLCPYDEASQSGVLCDALAHAVPTIVTRVGALPEQIGHDRAGVVLGDMSPQTLAVAMADVIRGRFNYEAASAGCLTLLRESAGRLAWTARLAASHA
jgi:glycosyltransferase involved in cell wall biosynthesis